MRFSLLGSTLALAVAVTRLAHAGDDGAEATKPVESRSRPEAKRTVEVNDYRLSLLAADLTALSLVIVPAIFIQNEDTVAAFAITGIGTYAVAPPTIHLAHEQPWRALGSLGLRVGLPAVGLTMTAAMIASSCDSSDDGYCALGGLIFGGLITTAGVLTAIIVDDAYLGRAPRAERERVTSRKTSLRLGLAPLLEPKRKVAGAALVGTF